MFFSSRGDQWFHTGGTSLSGSRKSVRADARLDCGPAKCHRKGRLAKVSINLIWINDSLDRLCLPFQREGVLFGKCWLELP